MMSVIPQHRQAITPMNTPYENSHQWTICAGRSRSQKRIGLAILALLISVAPAFAQGTLAPVAMQQFFTNSGQPAAGYWLCVYEANSSTAATVYSNVTLTTPFSNPIVMSSAGRPQTSNVELPIFLSPGRSYKFVFKSPTTPVNCNTGITIWSVDFVGAVPASSAALDVSGVAGESIAAGDVVYQSTGASGAGANAGQWYKADADNTQTSTSVLQIGVAPSAITSGASGSIRIAGVVTVAGPLAPGQAYYVSSTVGGMTATPPTNAIRIGQAGDSATSLLVGYTAAPVSPRGPPCGRLTLTSNTPVTTTDVTAATTLYYTPYLCNQLDVFNGTNWTTFSFAQVSIAVPATTNQMYDAFLYDNAGTLALELTAWTNDTTRATALTTQNGVYVKTGATSRLYLGSFRTTGVSGQTEDSLVKRYVWNYYNRVPRDLRVVETTNSWVYSTATYRQANASTANQLDFVIGVSEDVVTAGLQVLLENDTGTTSAGASVGLDSTTTVSPNVIGGVAGVLGAAVPQFISAQYQGYPGIGRHTLVWLERGAPAGATTWYGDAFSTYSFFSGLRGVILG